MAQYNINIEILPHKELLDPQGKAVTMGLKNMGLTQIDNVRVGKHISFEVSAASEKEAYDAAEQACKNLLVNPIMEGFKISVASAI